jgi:hypothetical protein
MLQTTTAQNKFNMEAKLKAIELVNKFSTVGLQQREEGIACAIMAVNEIIEAIDWHEFETPNKQINYWLDVRKEIHNL